ncbi:MAG: SusC/RagA family TonB-linked outer membrane protein [Flavobacterium psychrophilum]|nr:MAG: SusC/RagA family TonB-linked outer membrane protein [Flavobacterium psychrophilum]
MKFISANKGLRVLFYSLILATLPISALARAHASPTCKAFYQQVISGTVSDATGPLPGAIIAVKGKNLAIAADAAGRYAIAANSGDIIVFSFTGFKTVEVTITSSNVIDITLEEDHTQLEELTINAGYYNVKQKEATGSISRITAKDIENQPVANVLATMQGRMAGVNIIQNTGVPGGGFDIQIRGLNSLRSGGNAPLYIIDGVPYSSQAIGNSQTSTVLPNSTSPLNSINPSDIESIEVLKDADATAIYGSRGANGVVLITTKKGKAGVTTYTAGISSGFGRVTRFADMMKTPEYIAMREEAFANDGITTYPANAYDINGTWDRNRYTDWQKEITGGTAQITEASASVSGGTEQTQALISGNYRKETTVFPGEFEYNKANIHTNFGHQSNDGKFRVSFSASYTMQDNDLPWKDLTMDAKGLAPNAPALYNDDGSLNWADGTWDNPLRHLEGKFKAKTYDLITNAMLSWDIWRGISFRTSLGFTDLRHDESRTFPSTVYNPSYGAGAEFSSVFFNTTNRQSWIIEPQLNWKQEFGKLKTEVLGGSTFQKQNYDQLVVSGMGFPSNAMIYNLAAATTKTILSDDQTVYKYQALFGRANFNYDGRYIVNITARRDGSSRFGPGNQFANFGAIGLAWIFSNESFLKEFAPLSFGKLRASYGTSGNDQIGDYQYLNTYSGTGVGYNGVIGLRPTRLFNENFSWETNKKLELAMETGFFNDRVFLTLAYYRNRSSNQLVGIPLPGTTGFTNIQANLGATVENKGLEATLNTLNWQTKEFSWRTSFNISAAKNKLIEFPGLAESTYRNQFVIGQPTNIRLLYVYKGVNPETGIYEFEDLDGDGVITAQGDRSSVADFNPKFFGGLQNTFTYKGLVFDFLFQFVRQKNWNANYLSGMPGTMSNQPTSVINRWQEPGDLAFFQQYSTGTQSGVFDAFMKYSESTAGFSDASFIRLKNVSLSYTLPDQWLKGVKCRLRVEAQNLLTVTSYKGADPEFGTAGFLPPLKMITTGIQITY